MNYSCSEPDCENQISHICTCEEGTQIFCSPHYLRHLNLNQDYSHNIKPIPQISLFSNSLATIALLQKKISDLVASRTSLIAKAAEIHEIFVKSIIEKTRSIAVCEDLIKEILQSNKISFIYSCGVVPSKPQIKDIPTEIEQRLLKCSPQYSNRENVVKQAIDKLEVAEQVVEEVESNSEKLFFFKNNTKNLFEFDPSDLSIQSHQIETPCVQGNCQAICLISKDILFVSGGWSLQFDLASSSFLVDLRTKACTELPRANTLKHNASALYLNRKVYIFGGTSIGEALSDANAFNITTNAWESLTSLPYPVDNTSTLLIGEDILISGDPIFLNKYNPNANTYYFITDRLNITFNNFLIKYQDKVIIITSKIYTSNERLTDWNEIQCNIESFPNTCCRPVVRGCFVYICNWKDQVLQLNLNSYEMNMIRTV